MLVWVRQARECVTFASKGDYGGHVPYSGILACRKKVQAAGMNRDGALVGVGVSGGGDGGRVALLLASPGPFTNGPNSCTSPG